jgi:S-adenosylmethionine-dependent methyltransferase
MEPGMTDPFRPAEGRWLGNLGRLRDAVRQEVLRDQLAGLGPLRGGPARVLDAGCGQGTQALHLARAGHDVTGLDPSARLLGEFRRALAAEPPEVAARVRLVQGPGEDAARRAGTGFGAVLCHGVLMYQPDPLPLLAGLTAAAGPGGVLSLLVRNGMALAMRDGLRGDAAAARAAFGRLEYVNRLGLPARAHTPGQLDAILRPLGWSRDAWFGVRVFCDHRDEPAPAAGPLGELVAAEREAGRTDPYRSVAALLHLVYRRAGPPAGTV